LQSFETEAIIEVEERETPWREEPNRTEGGDMKAHHATKDDRAAALPCLENDAPTSDPKRIQKASNTARGHHKR
jgi:hypothetical protein